MDLAKLDALAFELSGLLKKHTKAISKQSRREMRSLLAKIFALSQGKDTKEAEAAALCAELENAIATFQSEAAAPRSSNESQAKLTPENESKDTVEPVNLGYFEMVSLKVREFFVLRACKEPIRVGAATNFAQNYADSVFERVDRFIRVLSKDAAPINTEAYKGYRDELIKNMPERGLVLHPPKRKR
jgi:hypothetical protein